VVEFLAQCSAVNAEYLGCAALIAASEIHDCGKQGVLNFAQNQIVQFPGVVAIKVDEVIAQCLFGQIPERPVFDADQGCLARSSGLFCDRSGFCCSRHVPVSPVVEGLFVISCFMQR